MPTNWEIFEEDRVGSAVKWIRVYIMNNPNWVPTLEQLGKISKRFKITEGKALELYERLKEECKARDQVHQAICFFEKNESLWQ